jgi:glycosyltransferase involved in cell wall biosynthesis
MMRVVQLMASPFFGGPERQILGLARHLPSEVVTIFLSFPERGLAKPFLDEAAKCGFESRALTHNTPHLFASVREVAEELRRCKTDLLCCSGYKPDIVGWRAARRLGIPVVAIAHGWTGATWKVRINEWLDKLAMRSMDRVVCVSKAQADKVRAARVAEGKIITIQNSIGADAFVQPDAAVRAEMLAWFAQPPRLLVGAAGRHSPEKGYAIFVDAAAKVAGLREDTGFVLFGDGPLRGDLERRVHERGLSKRFVIGGFRADLQRFLPNLDLAVMSSYTEGLPVILLETGAAGVPTVATAVGGIPEVIDDGISGWLAPSGDATALADRIESALSNDARRKAIGDAARERVRRDFSFEAMAGKYLQLFRSM